MTLQFVALLLVGGVTVFGQSAPSATLSTTSTGENGTWSKPSSLTAPTSSVVSLVPSDPSSAVSAVANSSSLATSSEVDLEFANTLALKDSLSSQVLTTSRNTTYVAAEILSGSTNRPTIVNGSNASANITTTPTALIAPAAHNATTAPLISASAVLSSNGTAKSMLTTSPVAWNATTANTTNINATTTAAANATGYDYASACDSSSFSWSSASLSWLRWHAASYLYTASMFNVDTYYGTSFAPTTATSCLGQSRVMGGQVLSVSPTSESTYNTTYVYMTSSEATPFPTPRPTCSVGSTDCASIWDAYDSSTNWIEAQPYVEGATINWPQTPLCDDPRVNAYCRNCEVRANEVEMYYWPMVAVGEPCDPDRSFMTAPATIPDRPNTAVMGNYTFTSPTVYLSFGWIYAASGRSFCGPSQVTSTIIAVPPEDVSTVRFSYTEVSASAVTFVEDDTTFTQTDPRLELGTYTLDGFTDIYTVSGFRVLTATSALPASFGDFMGAVPADAWSADPANALHDASVIVDAQYSPYLAVPSIFRSLYPAWANCSLYVSGVWDPPIPLQPATSIAGPSGAVTTTSEGQTSVTTAPAPASQLDDPTPLNTAVPLPTSTVLAKEPSDPATSQTTVGEGSRTSVSRPTTSVVSVSVIVQITTTRAQSQPDTNPSDGVPDPIASGTIVAPPVGPVQASTGAVGSKPIISAGSASSTDSVVPQPTVPSSTTLTIGGQPVAVTSAGSILIVGSQTVTSGSSPVTVAGQAISLGSGGLVVETTSAILPLTSGLSATISRTVVVGGSSVLAAVQGSVAVVNGQTITVGGSAVNLAGEQITLASTGLVAVGTSTLLPAAAKSTEIAQPGQFVNINGAAVSFVPTDGGVLISDGVTTSLVKAGDVTTLQGNNLRLTQSGDAVIINGAQVIPLDPGIQSETTAVSVGGTPMTITRVGTAVILTSGDQAITLDAGNSAVFAGHLVSLASNGGSVTFDAYRTVPISPASALPSTSAEIMMLDGEPVYILRASSGMTVSDGTATVEIGLGQTEQFHGHAVTAARDGSSVVVDGVRTIILDPGSMDPASPGAILMLGDTPVSVLRVGNSVVLSDGITAVLLTAGTTIIYNSHTVTLASDAQSLTVDGTQIVSLSAIAVGSSIMVTRGGHVWGAITYGNTVVLTDGTTSLELRPSEQVSLPASGGRDGLAAAYTTLATVATRPAAALITAPASLGGAVFTASIGANGAIMLIDGTTTVTLQPGAVTTFDGAIVSAAADGSYIVVDGSRTVYLGLSPTTTSPASAFTSALLEPAASAAGGGRQAVASDPAAEAGAERKTGTGIWAVVIVAFLTCAIA